MSGESLRSLGRGARRQGIGFAGSDFGVTGDGPYGSDGWGRVSVELASESMLDGNVEPVCDDLGKRQHSCTQ